MKIITFILSQTIQAVPIKFAVKIVRLKVYMTIAMTSIVFIVNIVVVFVSALGSADVGRVKFPLLLLLLLLFIRCYC